MSTMSQIKDRVFDLTKRLTETYPSRRAGDKGCIECAGEIEKELKSFCNSVHSEHFSVHKGAFLGWIRILVAFYAIGVAFLWIGLPLVTALLLGTGIIIMVLQFFLYKHAIDFLYPKRKGINVWGSVEPEDEVKSQIIISGHHDSARIFNFFIHQPKLYSLRVTGGIGILCAIFVLSIICSIIGSIVVTTITAAISTLGALIVLQLWFFASAKATPGAGDNMVASAMAVEALREFSERQKKGSGLKNTRVVALSFDAEEEGLRGAYAYAQAHKEEFENLPTVLYNIDCPYELKDMFFLKTDINGSVQLDEELSKQCVQIAANLGYKAEEKEIAFLTGGTDAAELAKLGVSATTMMAMPWNNSERASVYHTPDDTVDALDTACIEAGLEIFFKLVEEQDKAYSE